MVYWLHEAEAFDCYNTQRFVLEGFNVKGSVTVEIRRFDKDTHLKNSEKIQLQRPTKIRGTLQAHDNDEVSAALAN